MIKKGFFLLPFVLVWGSTSAQNQTLPCATNEYIKHLDNQQPGTQKNIEETFFDAKRFSNIKFKNKKDTIYTIQVVFHVVYSNSLENLDEDYITSQMKELNECFRRQNPDTIDTREIFLPVAADAGIEFELAAADAEYTPS